jgi:hypothetical protein
MRTKENMMQLRHSLVEVMDGTGARPVIASVVDTAHGLALAYLRVAGTAVQGLLARAAMNPEDAAYDAIAELFAKDGENHFPVLARWWNALSSSDKGSDAILAPAFRRLVIGAVHQRVFQMYRESDPFLAKIIRNIKLALRHHVTVQLTMDRGEPAIMPLACRSLHSGLPGMPNELLLPGLFDAVTPRSSLKEMLGIIGSILRKQRDYRRVVRVVDAAVLIREVYLSDALWDTSTGPSEGLSAEEIAAILSESLSAVRESVLANYRHRRVLDQCESDAFALALSEIVQHMFVDAGGRDGSFFDFLKRHLPALTRAEYGAKHRVIMEYLVKSTTYHIRKRVRPRAQ